jgi:tetratricopeptide (TPR) repeat protein
MLPNGTPHALRREQRLDEAVTSFLEAEEAGRRPDRAAWLARYADVARELAQFFAAQDEVDRLAGPLRAVARAALGATPPPGDTPPTGRWDACPPDRPAPSAPDGYELLQVLGQGGMGLVYRARQKSAGRLVALKLIRAERLGSEADLHRFRNEAETAAQLDHPHIVPVYEVGACRGRLYFSMKLVEGGSLDGQLARFQGDTRAAARLLATVARAVHHAHQRGVLHRDLKPSNILLEWRAGDAVSPVPFVSDFGLAKRVAGPGAEPGEQDLTQTGAIIGTPSYMAPEQTSGARRGVTTAADVYGLGALLYALLTGRPPFRADNAVDTLLWVREREPEPPSRVNAQVDRDLETVCLKCLEKDPERRYPSAEALAEDLERWLSGGPIHSRPLPWRARWWRWCGRNPLVAGLVACTGLLLALGVAGLASGAWLLWQEREETRAALAQAREHSARAETQRHRAETNFRHASSGVGLLLDAYDPKWKGRPRTFADVRRWQMKIALRLLAPFCEDQSAEPERRLQKGIAYVHRGRVYQYLGNQDQARQAFLQAAAVFDGLTQDYPDDPTYPFEQGTALHILAEHLYDAGRVPEANAYHSQAMRVLRVAVQAHPAHAETARMLAWWLCVWFDPNQRDPKAAVGPARKAVKLDAHFPDSWKVLGVAYYRSGQWDAAVKALRRALQLSRGEKKFARATATFFLAMAQWRCGKWDEGLKAYRQATRRMRNNRGTWDDLDRAAFAEASALLGIREAPPPRPKAQASPP